MCDLRAEIVYFLSGNLIKKVKQMAKIPVPIFCK